MIKINTKDFTMATALYATQSGTKEINWNVMIVQPPNPTTSQVLTLWLL